MNGGDCKDVPVTEHEDAEVERLCPYPGRWLSYPTMPAWVGRLFLDGLGAWDGRWAMWK
jgi:hypothetical protein